MDLLTPSTFLVDNSLLEVITTCPWAAYAAIIRRRKPAGDAPALRFGGILHEALAARYTGKPESEQLAIMEARFRAEPCELEGWRNYDSAVKVIRGYNSYYTKEDFSVLRHPRTGLPLVEQAFAVDTHRVIRGRRVVYLGRIDLVAEMPSRDVFTLDHKTSSMLGDTFWEAQGMTGQHKGYIWALREALGIECTGYIVNAIGVKDALVNAVFDETLCRVIAGLTNSGRQSKATPLELLRQQYFTKVPPGQIDEWFENMIQQVDRFLYNVDMGTFPRYTKHCIGLFGRCQFYNVCSLPSESREQALTSGAYADNTWTPLEKAVQSPDLTTKTA